MSKEKVSKKLLKDVTVSLFSHCIKVNNRADWENPTIEIIIPKGAEVDRESSTASIIIGDAILNVSIPPDLIG